MRRPIVVLALVATLACASSGTLPRSRTYMQPLDQVWEAALAAVADMGGRVVSSSPSGGSILGRVEVTDVGGMVNLDITVREWLDGAEVRVTASEPGSSRADPTRADALRQVEEDYLDLVDRRVPGTRGP